MFLVISVFSRYFRNFLLATLSAEMIKGYIYIYIYVKLQIYFNSSAKFHFVILSQFREDYGSRELLYLL